MKTNERNRFHDCQCSDRECKAHSGKEKCELFGNHWVSRYDYELEGDHFWFCDGCTDDALESGVFSLSSAE